MATITTAALIAKIRRITARPTAVQMTDNDIIEAVNLFYEYDYPFENKDFNFKSNFTFYTQPNQDNYDLTSIIIGSSGISAINFYKSFQGPVYINGRESSFFEDEAEFFRIYPKIDTIEDVAVADGGVGPYTGTITATPILRESLLFSATTPTGTNLLMIDNGSGQLIEANSPLAVPPILGTINYTTGVFTVTFNGSGTESGTDITAKFHNYASSRPHTILYHEDSFTLRPVPDDSYEVKVEAYLKPTSFFAGFPLSVPSKFINDYFELLAYGAAANIFIDEMEMEMYAAIKPILDEQILKVGRRTIMQIKNQQVSTLYNRDPLYPQPFSTNRI